jgi:hypothetical protein
VVGGVTPTLLTRLLNGLLSSLKASHLKTFAYAVPLPKALFPLLPD